MVTINPACNPEDGNSSPDWRGLRTIGTAWALGVLDYSDTYGEDSAIAKQLMASDVTAGHRQEIAMRYYTESTEGALKSYSISESGDESGQFARDAKSMITGNHNLSTAALGSYTADYKILRANSAGIQAKITIRNSMSPSSFAHIATGYKTPADRWVQRWFDNDGLVALGGAMRAHDMKITFRTVIPN